jgi:large subunit ribosomal protein L25
MHFAGLRKFMDAKRGKAMANQVTIEAQPRTVLGKQVRALRRQGILPARIYGYGDSVPVQIDERIFERLLEKHQTTGVLLLSIAGQAQGETVLVRHIEHEPRTGRMQHVDFARVRMNVMMHARVPLHVSGESPYAKLIGGSVLPLIETIEIECLPGNLPDTLTIDVSQITTADAMLHVRDLQVPPGVKILANEDEPVVKVEPPRGAAETPAPAATEAPATPPTP